MAQCQQNNGTQSRPLVTPWEVLGFASLPLELVLHRLTSFGARSVGPRIGGAFLLMLLFAAFHPNNNSLILILFALSMFPLGITAQVSASRRLRQGEELHTRYNGQPRAMKVLPRLSELTIKRLEPFVAFAIGMIVHRFNYPLGSFLITSAISLGLRTAVQITKDSTRRVDFHDAIIEQRISAENLRRNLR